MRYFNCKFIPDSNGQLYTYACAINNLSEGDYAIVNTADDIDYPYFKIVRLVSQAESRAKWPYRLKYLLQKVDFKGIRDAEAKRERAREIRKDLDKRLVLQRRRLELQTLLESDGEAASLVNELRRLGPTAELEEIERTRRSGRSENRIIQGLQEALNQEKQRAMSPETRRAIQANARNF